MPQAFIINDKLSSLLPFCLDKDLIKPSQSIHPHAISHSGGFIRVSQGTDLERTTWPILNEGSFVFIDVPIAAKDCNIVLDFVHGANQELDQGIVLEFSVAMEAKDQPSVRARHVVAVAGASSRTGKLSCGVHHVWREVRRWLCKISEFRHIRFWGRCWCGYALFGVEHQK